MFLACRIFLILAGLNVCTPSVRAQDNPLNLYGEQIRFEIRRQGKPVGSHVVSFERAGGAIRSRSAVHLAVDFLYFTAFRYRFESHALWREGLFERIDVDIDDNGKKLRLAAIYDGERTSVSGTAGALTVPAPLQATEHWNAEILTQHQVFNTLTGKINNVAIRPGHTEWVETERGPVAATVYHYSGDLVIDVWYDERGRWVKMRFKGRDGSLIDYICRQCQGPEKAS